MNEILSGLSRRDFLALSAAGAGSGLVAAVSGASGDSVKGSPGVIHVAFVGFGRQGQVLFEAMKNIPGLHFQAVCDIWDFNLGCGKGKVRALKKHIPNGYVDIDEMLATEKGLDAVIVATPDHWHAEYTVKCLRAGLHVYCEKMMAHTLDGAREIVRAAEETGRVCQIGYQRRSNPRYRYTLEQLVQRHKLCGRISGFNAQWNRSVRMSQDIPFRPSLAVAPDMLARYGYRDMHQLLNWRNFREFGGGPLRSLGCHQIDVCHWFLGGRPRSVMASGDCAIFKQRDIYDTWMGLLEYETPSGSVRAFFQTLAASSGGNGYFERFIGDRAELTISENSVWTRIQPSGTMATDSRWLDLEKRGYVVPVFPESEFLGRNKDQMVFSRPSRPLPEYTLPGGLNKAPHQPHLENFFAAIRGEAKLNCDARTAFATEAVVWNFEAAAREHRIIDLSESCISV